MTEQHFDIVIIGAGPGGYSTALRAAQLGKTVALIERDKTLGGTCLNRGCIPSKALLTAAHSAQNIRQAERMGISATLQSIDFGKLRDFRTSTVETMTKGLAGLLSHRGVTVFRGEAELRDVHDVHVAPAGGEAQVMRSFKAGVEEPVGSELTIKGEDIVLATGSRPLPLPGQPVFRCVDRFDAGFGIGYVPVQCGDCRSGCGGVGIRFVVECRGTRSDVADPQGPRAVVLGEAGFDDVDA